MAKTLINQSGIDFTVETGGKTHQGWGKKYTNLNNILNGVYDPDQQNVEKSINTVEIDWNGAVLKGADLENNANLTLNTSGDLLKLIEDIQKEIYVLSAAVIALGSN